MTICHAPPVRREADLQMTEDAMRKAIFDPFEEEASHEPDGACAYHVYRFTCFTRHKHRFTR